MTIGVALLECPWWDFDENPRQASAFPFFEGVSCYSDNLAIYHLNFYNTQSFEDAINHAETIPEKRKILYIGAHGKGGRMAGGNLAVQMQKIPPKSYEGIILSSCEVGKK
ncbi:MAG: hypothetical protein LBN96_00020 [Desulfovibrio sp.]|nr:hypothetical protein [Desulfovibrio sp.]